jgi:hypothetical protein
MSRMLAALAVDDWKRSVAMVILYAYGYQLVAWPLLAWGTTLFTAFTGFNLPVPPIVPWEHLMAGTTTLAAIGGIQTWRERGAQESMTSTTTITARPGGDDGAPAK